MRSPLPYTVNRPFASRSTACFHQRTTPCKNARSPSGRRSGIRQGGCKTRAAAVGTARAASRPGCARSWCALAIVVPPVPRFVHCTAHASIYMEGEGMLMSKSCKPLHPGLFLLGAATAALVFAAPQTCAEAFRQGLALCGGPLLVSLFPFLVVSALIMRSGAGEVLGVLLWPVVRCIGLRSRSAGSVLLIGLVGGFAPAAAATAEAVPQQGTDLAGGLRLCCPPVSAPGRPLLSDGRGAAAGQPYGGGVSVCRTGTGRLADSCAALPCSRHTGAFARAARCRAN